MKCIACQTKGLTVMLVFQVLVYYLCSHSTFHYVSYVNVTRLNSLQPLQTCYIVNILGSEFKHMYFGKYMNLDSAQLRGGLNNRMVDGQKSPLKINHFNILHIIFYTHSKSWQKGVMCAVNLIFTTQLLFVTSCGFPSVCMHHIQLVLVNRTKPPCLR